MSLLNSVTRFARSEKGRRLTAQARAAAARPENRRKVTEMVGRFRGGKR